MRIQRLQSEIDRKNNWTEYDELAYRLEEYIGETVLVSDLPLLIGASTDEDIEREVARRGVKIKIMGVQDVRTPSWMKVQVVSQIETEERTNA